MGLCPKQAQYSYGQKHYNKKSMKNKSLFNIAFHCWD